MDRKPRDGHLLLIDPKTGQTSRRTPEREFVEEDYCTDVADAPPHCEGISAHTKEGPRPSTSKLYRAGALKQAPGHAA
jgi:hypothetical protein